MRVTMRTILSGPYGTAVPGQDIELPEDVAYGLIEGGYAVQSGFEAPSANAVRADAPATEAASEPSPTQDPAAYQAPSEAAATGKARKGRGA